MANSTIFDLSEVAKIHVTKVGEKVINLVEQEIDEIYGTISNEHIWELGYEGTEENPHTKNIEDLRMAAEFLKFYKKVLGVLAPDKLIETSINEVTKGKEEDV